MGGPDGRGGRSHLRSAREPAPPPRGLCAGSTPVRLLRARLLWKWPGRVALTAREERVGARAAGAPQTALHPAVNSIITGHRVGAPLK